MDRTNYIVRVSMSPEEMDGFQKLAPLVSCSINRAEANMISKLLGHDSMKSLVSSGIPHNPFLRNAFSIISFLYLSRDDPMTFEDFWNRLIFTDKDVEKKVRKTFQIDEESGTMSATQLDLIYLLDSDRDELDGKNLGD